MKTLVLCLVDKEYPPAHSFIDGMLCSKELRDQEMSVIVLTSKGNAEKRVLRYKDAIALPILRPRNGVQRFINLWNSFLILKSLIVRYKCKSVRIVLFVRNEPIYLLVASFCRSKVDKLIFQQSFPHEKSGSNIVKKAIAKSIFRITRRKVDALLAVSPLGLERMREYFGKQKKGTFIPLLNGNETTTECYYRNKTDLKGPIRIIYTGTHAKGRQLEVVLRAIYEAKFSPEQVTFTFIGGNEKDVNRLRKIINTKQMEKNRLLTFKPKIQREQLLKQLREYDVGLCLIPPDPIYIESSPTKLVEYMGAGLAVIATRGIPLQEKFIKESEGGILTSWNKEDIIIAFKDFIQGREFINIAKDNSYKYASNHLKYINYIEDFKQLC